MGSLPTLFQDGKFLVKHGKFHLGFEDIDLTSLARTEPRVGYFKKLFEQMNLLMMNLDRLIRKKQVVVDLRETGDQLPVLRS